MTDQPREWRDEQGFTLVTDDGALLRFRLGTRRQQMGIYFTEQEARFLLRVLPEALGIPLSELGGTVISRLEALTERVLARDEKAAALDRAIVEAAERWHDSHVSSRIGEHDQCAIELRRAVEAKRSATSSPSSAGRKDGERG